jgi:hypothetical protein
MKRLVGLVVLALFLAALISPVLAQDKDKAPSVKSIMTRAHKGADSALAKARSALKDGDYDELNKAAGTLVKLGQDLTKAKPPAGEAKSWKEKTSDYVKTVKTLEKAAKDKDEKSAKKALSTLFGSCKKCHDEHK